MNYFNLHTHSNYCDGAGEPEQYVISAFGKGFDVLGFSSHAPVPFKNNFAIRDEEKLKDYCDSVIKLKEKYIERISICLGLEIDFIEGISEDFEGFRTRYPLDYIIGSVHLVKNENLDGLWFIDGPKQESFDGGLRSVFSGDVRLAVTTYYHHVKKMLIDQKPDILGHFDKIKMHNKGRYFREDEPWYRDLVMDLLDTIKSTGVIPEVNTRGIYKKRSNDLYPGVWILREMKKMDIPVTLSADAHHPSEIDGYYAEAIEILKEIGYRSVVCYKAGKWVELVF